MTDSPVGVADLLLFCHRAIDAMVIGVERLDDTLVNTAPPVPHVNTPAQLVVHALSACEWWCAFVICGHPTPRDRDAEFMATSTVDALRQQASELKERLTELAPEIAAKTDLHIEPTTTVPLGVPWTVGAALVHAYEELAQHLGHLEITVDMVLAGVASTPHWLQQG